MNEQFMSIFNNINSKFILETLRNLMIDPKTRILADEFSTIVYNAKVEGQFELLQALEEKIHRENNKTLY